MDASVEATELCLHCRRINFDCLIREDPDVQKDGRFRFGASYDLGSTRDLIQRKGECRLCCILAKCLEEVSDGVISLDAGGSTIKCVLQEIPVAFLPSARKWKSLYSLSFSVEAEVNQQSTDGSDSSEYSAELCFQAATRTLMSKMEELKPAPLRPRPLRCDFQNLKTWLRQCETVHGPLCSSPGYYEVPAFRLVDACSRCIIDASVFEKTPKYITLSYVWGTGAQKWHLTARSLASVCEEGFLDTVPLATTICDAMQLVREIGERFLWVDSLCIIQDSEEDKLQQIPYMGSIYEQALVTIVAASAEDANGGLPGVRPGTRNRQPHVLQTGELTLTSTLETEIQNLVGFHQVSWPIDNRKWTFQEGLLSRRCLIFSKEQVYWQCQRTMWSEEMLLQPTQNSAFAGWTLWCLNRKNVNINAVAGEADGEFANTYRYLVQNYSNRSSTFPVDTLHAFQGIISVITRLTDVTFIWAIPQPGFDCYLLWTDNRDLGRGSRCVTTMFPSWSWIAWEGEVRPPDLSDVPELECYVLECDEICLDLANTPLLRIHCDNKRIQTLSNKKHRDPTYPMRDWKQKDLTITTNDISKLHAKASLVGRFHLFFWTSLASLYVCDDQEETKLCLPVTRKGLRACPDFISSETSSGERIVELEPGRQIGRWPLQHGRAAAAAPSLHDFIVVGSRVDYDPATLTIMMISWREGIAQRECLTTINEKDWMETDRSWRLVVLG